MNIIFIVFKDKNWTLPSRQIRWSECEDTPENPHISAENISNKNYSVFWSRNYQGSKHFEMFVKVFQILILR